MHENGEQADRAQHADVNADQETFTQPIIFAVANRAHDHGDQNRQAGKGKEETNGRHQVLSSCMLMPLRPVSYNQKPTGSPAAPMKSPETFAEVWRRYLSDHTRAGTRALHFLGIGLAVAALILSVVTLNPTIAIIGTVMGYVFSWCGHFLIEQNQPSMFGHPVWSFQCDVRMLRLWLAGRLDVERARARVRSEPVDSA